MNIFDPGLDEGKRLQSEGMVEDFLDEREFVEEDVEEEVEEEVAEGEALALSGDFITDYMSYADVLEAPAEAHEAVAISLLAAALNEKVYFRNGPMKLSLDLWVLLLSGSGLGRNTLVDLARPILKEAGLNTMVKNETWGSGVALYQNVAENPCGLFLWPEFSVVMRAFGNANFGGVKEWVTDRFDNWNIPDAIQYRRTGKSGDTPPIVFTHAPRLNLLATSSFDWFVGSLSEQDSTGGFVPRWLIFQLGEPTKLVAVPKETDHRFIAPLAARLAQARELEGEADFNWVIEMYESWYEEARERFASQSNRALAMPFFRRLRTNILKLAVVYEVSQSGDIVVTPDAMVRAIETSNKLEQSIFGLLPTGMSQEGSLVDRIAARIMAAGPEGLSQSELTRAFQSWRGSDREGRIQTLIQSGTVHRFLRLTAGRNALIYVHQDHMEEHRSQFPGDASVNRLG
jgi:hypothetical protein